MDPDWGEPDLTPAERRVFGWSSSEVLAFHHGNPDRPVNAIPPRASCHCQLRYVVGVDPADIVAALERHLADAGFPMVKVTAAREGFFPATRLDPNHPWVVWVKQSIEKTSRKPTAILPNLGGSLPNDVFSDCSACRPLDSAFYALQPARAQRACLRPSRAALIIVRG